MNVNYTRRPSGTARIFFIFDLWPVLLVYLVGPIGNLISSGGLSTGPQYTTILVTNLSIYVVLCIVAAVWAYQPLALVMKRWTPGMLSHSGLLEQSISELPLRVARSFSISGLLFATYLLVIVLLTNPQTTSDVPVKLILAMALSLYFAFAVVAPALAVTRALIFSMRLRKKMSRLGLFWGKPDTSRGRQRVTVSIASRPWLLFIITSVVPILIMALFFFIGRDVDSASHEHIILAQISIMFFGVLIVGSYLVHTMRRSLLLVMNELKQGMVAIQKGDFKMRVAALTDDEMGDMASSLNTALSGLQERDDLKDALHIASEIQSGLLPKSQPTLPGFQMQAYQQSCFEVGGDFYDFIETDDGRVWLIVADVAGKGYPAALTVANLHATLHTLASSGPAFVHIPAFINRALYNTLTRGLFVTLFMAELHPRSASLSWFSAGHTPAVLISNNDTRLLEASGPPLGMLAEVTIGVHELTMAHGAVLVILTDGITEMRASREKSELFGMQRVVDWFNTHPLDDLNKVTKELLKDFRKFGKPAKHDDLTLLLLRRL